MRRKIARRVLAACLSAGMVFTSMFTGHVNGWGKSRVAEVSNAAGGFQQELLNGDEAYVSSILVSGISDGTAPFDDEAGRGKDTGPDDRTVRSYDTITYTLDYNIATYDETNSYKSGYIWFEADLDYPVDKAYFDVGAMNWMSKDEGYQYEIITSADGNKQTLRCAAKLVPTGDNLTTVPGSGQVEIVVSVRGMVNEEVVQPKFRSYMDYNEGLGENCPTHNKDEYASTVPEEVKVSTIPSYNVQLKTINSQGAYAGGTWDFSTGNENALNKSAGSVEGRLVGFGITLQMYNPETNKGIKGLEIPTGPIEFDIDMSSAFFVDNSKVKDLTDEKYTPLVWSYGPSSKAASIDGRDVSKTYGTTYLAAPYNSKDDATLSEVESTEMACYDGGSWTVTQTGSKLHFVVKDYSVNMDYLPKANSGEALSDSNSGAYGNKPYIGCFSAGELFVVIPYADLVSENASGNIELLLTDSGMTATSVTGVSQVNDNQGSLEDDVAAAVTHFSKPGTYVNRVHYSYYDNNYIAYAEDCDQGFSGDTYRNGQDALSIGNKVAITWGGVSNAQGEEINVVEAMDSLLKFDDKVLEYDSTKAFHTNRESNNSHTFYFAAKPDGTGWASDAEMRSMDLDIEDFIYYKTYEELVNDGKVCVGILDSFRCKHSENDHKDINLTNQDVSAKAYFKIKTDNTLTGGAYQTVSESNVYRRIDLSDVTKDGEIDTSKIPSIYEVQNGATEHVRSHENVKYDYVKATYDSAGNYTGGHSAESSNGWEHGDTLYLAGYITKINKEILQKNSSGETKNIYDLSAGQNIVDFQITSRMEVSNGVEWTEPTTVTITDYLPEGLEYVDGSAVIGGTYTPAPGGEYDGTISGTAIIPKSIEKVTVDGKNMTKIVWEVPNYTVQDNGPTIMYKAEIDGKLPNNTQLDTSAEIQTTEDKRQITKSNGNIDAVGLKLTKLSQVSVTKRSESPYYELHDNIKYYITWSNNSDVDETIRVLLDILPVNGQNGSKFSGTYSVRTVSVNSRDDYRIFYTKDDLCGLENKDEFVKDEIVAGLSNGISWTEATLTDGATTLGKDVTGWAIITNIPAGKSVTATVILDTNATKAGDIFYNEARLGTGGNGSGSKAAATTVDRSLSGTTWIDKDRDGIREDGEVLLPGVTVTLYDENGKVVKDVLGNECITTTNSNGDYLFEHLPEGNIKVVFSDGTVTLSEYVLTKDNSGTDDKVDSDATEKDGETSITGIEMPTGKWLIDNPTKNPYKVEHLDAGFYQSGSLSITKAVTSGDRTEDPTFEVSVTFDSPAVLTVVKDSNDNSYTVTDNKIKFNIKNGETVTLVDIPDGTKYTVSETDTALYYETVQYANSKRTITTTTDKVMLFNKRVNRQLSGTAWGDANRDGKRDDDEILFKGVKVTVYDSEGNVVKDLLGNDCIANTDEDGNYLFTNLPAGELKVVFTDGTGDGATKISEYTLTTSKASGVDETVNSDASLDTENDEISIKGIEMPEDKDIRVSPYKVEHQDAGFYKSRELSGLTWNDKDRDGIRDEGESIISGVTVTLKDKDGNTVNDMSGNPLKTTTSENGTYYFSDIPAGEFTVEFSDGTGVKISEYTLTTKDSGSDDTKDSDASAGENGTASVTGIEMPEDKDITGSIYSKEHVDAGFYQSGSLSVTKTVQDAEDGESDRTFDISVKFNSPAELKSVKDGNDNVYRVDDNGKVSFTLKAGETISFVDLPEGTTYLVTEVDSPLYVETIKYGNPDSTITVVNDKVTVNNQRVCRKLSGTTWGDENRDGKRDDSEVLFKGVTVTLYDADGKVVKDLLGNECIAKTDDDGNYLFTNLPAGEMKVVFTDGDKKISDYTLTKTKADGVATEVNSDAELADNVVSILDIVMPEDDAIVESPYHLPHLDAGFYKAREISGLTWIDYNRDGVQGDGEDILSGVTVTLRSKDGKIIKDLNGNECTVLTDSEGKYCFTDLPSGELAVVFSSGTTDIKEYILTSQDAGSDDTIDSDAKDNNNGTASVTDIIMPVDEEITGNVYKKEHVDAGFYQAGSLTIKKTVINAEIGDAEEFEIKITLDSPAELSVICDSDGNRYEIEDSIVTVTVPANGEITLVDIPAGTTYVVYEEDSPLYVETVEYENEDRFIVTDEDKVEVINKRVCRMLSGTTWGDANRDGKRDADEILFSGVTVTLYDENGAVVKDLLGNECIALTDSEGNYLFTNLPAGSMKVVFTDGTGEGATKISEYTLTKTKAAGVDSTVNSDAALVSGETCITDILMPNDEDIDESPYHLPHLDAGFYKSREISGLTWLDDNEDGIQDKDEKILSGVTVTLYDKNGNILKDMNGNVCTAKTDSEGRYSFTDLPYGELKVVFSDGTSKISEYVLTKQDAGSDDTVDSDAASGENSTAVVTGIDMPEDKDIIGKKYSKLHVDAGFYIKETTPPEEDPPVTPPGDNPPADNPPSDNPPADNPPTEVVTPPAEVTPPTDVNEPPTTEKKPKTGDDTNVILLGVLMLISAAGVMVVARKKRKDEK